MLRQGSYRLLLCERDLPDRDGMEWMQEVSAAHPEIAFVMAVKPRNLRDGMLAMLSGASGYVQTPLSSDNLTASLVSAAKRKELEAALGASSAANLERIFRKTSAQIA